MIDGIDVLIMVIKVLVVFGFLLVSVLLTIWAERRIVALMQQRIGPNRVGPFGVLQGLADGIKLFFKEDVTPTNVDRSVYFLAPVAALLPAFLAFAVVPVGRGFHIGHRVITLHLVDLNVGILFFLAMGSLMVYGIVLAGWSSGSTYPLLGAVRSTAQMISYEIGMGLSVVSVVLWSGTLSTSGIVDAQSGTWFGFVPRWFIIPQLPALVMFLLGGLAETNRAPFDLPEAETELVGGYHTEYTGIKFAMFFLAEYLHVITTSALVVTLFLGGWRGPNILPFLGPLLFVGYFLAKLGLVIFLFMWARATIPRIRYDRLMHLGWKVLIPASLVWTMITAAMVVLPQEVNRTTLIVVVGIVFEVALIVWLARLTTTALRRGRLRRGDSHVV
ncbi:MAG: NADH-quinone oxidoreductase subunit NuoH [Actinomycetota bacterium]|nr:NADH-quinone oxidoreductase subunit NuoH [Actinomycetota bacterium]